MNENNEKREETNDVGKDVFKTWTDSYTNVSKMWMDSYSNLYKPWIESAGSDFEKATGFLQGAAPQKYKEFYDEWVKNYQKTVNKFYTAQQTTTTKEVLEKLVTGAEESTKQYQLWIAELTENTRKTKELLQGTPDAAKYKEMADTWTKSYERIFDSILTTPLM